ncbi:MAG: hypothetical protein HUJ30_02400 [Gammaproteobacteria bacterium]|nr:hypothetical protein [Gammaproteobacteria bacterium]
MITIKVTHPNPHNHRAVEARVVNQEQGTISDERMLMPGDVVELEMVEGEKIVIEEVGS